MKLIIFLIILINTFFFQLAFCENDESQAATTSNVNSAPTSPSKSLWTAYILRQKKTTEKIPDLTLPTKPLPVFMVQKDGKIRPMIEVHGTFTTENWNLNFEENNLLKINPLTKEFTIYFYLNSYVNELLLTAKGPKDETLSEHIYVYAPNIQEFQVYSAWDSILFSFGETLFNYQQTGYGKFKSLTGMLSVQYASPDTSSHFGYFGQADLSILTQWASPEKENPQVLEGKLDGTYLLQPHFLNPQWRPQILLGASYLNMFNNNSPFGFSNLVSPDIGLRVRYFKDQKRTYIMDLRYMPLITPIDLDHRGFNLYFGISLFLPNYHRIELGFNFSDYYYLPTYNQAIRTQFGTIKLGYGL